MDTPRRPCVLIFRLGSIGDTVVALPCFNAVARHYPRHRRILLTNALTSQRASSAETVLDGTGLVDEVLYYPVGDFSLRHLLQLLGRLRRLRPSALIYLAERPTAVPVYRDVAFFRAAGVRTLIGVPWSAVARAGQRDPLTRELEPEAQRLAQLLESHMPVSLEPREWDLKLSAAEIAKADALLAPLALGDTHALVGSRALENGLPASVGQPVAGTPPLIAMAPGAKVPAKDWGKDHWEALLRSTGARFAGVGLALVGAADERSLCEGLAPLWAGPVVNLCGVLTPRETAAAFQRCRLLVCHDSGPMHLAAAVKTRCVALFGNYNQPRKWYPFGTGHRVIHEPQGVRAITVERVAREMQFAFENAGLDDAEGTT